jgi:hypothetical protein
MPINYHIDDKQQRVCTTVTGAITAADIVDHFKTARRDGMLSDAEVIEVNEVTPPFLSAPDIWSAAAIVREMKGEHKFGPRAIVVANDLIFGTTRIFTSLVGDFFPIAVFRDRKAAEQWLENWPCSRAG